MAPAVDWVIPGELIELPNGWSEIAISTECFEHCENWQKVFLNMILIAALGSLVVITCASKGRPTHGTFDSAEYSSPFTTSYYKNLGVDDISESTEMGVYFDHQAFEINASSHDLYFWDIRSGANIQGTDEYWDDPTSRLARAQGQLAQAAARQSATQSELDKIKSEADQARAEDDRTRAEADRDSTALRSIQNSNTWTLSKQIRMTIDAIQRLVRL